MHPRIALGIAAFTLVLPATAVGQGGTEPVVDEAGIGTLIAALDRVESETNELQTLGRLKLADIQVVGIGAVLAGDDVTTYGDALAKNRTAVEHLRTFLTTTDLQVVGADDVSMTFRDYLGDHGVGVGDIVALSVSGGSVTVFVDDSVEGTAVEGTIG